MPETSEANARRSLLDVVISNLRTSLSKMPPSTKQRGAASRRPSVIFAGGRLAKRFELIDNDDVE